MALDPDKFFIVLPNMFGNGLSSSPSNQPAPYNGPRFPNCSLYDNVMAQHQLVSAHLKIKNIFCVLGWSMGACQAYQWAVLFPNFVERIVPFCGSAKTSIHNRVFLEGPKSALMADHDFKEGWYSKSLMPNKGLRAFARVYSGWGMSQAFYREKVYEKEMGYASLEDFLVGFWEGYFLNKDPNNLLSQIWTWQHGDCSDNPIYKGDFAKSLQGIKSKSLIMPGSHDLYFPPEDSAEEVRIMNGKNAKLLSIPSINGHWAGGPGTFKADVDFINTALELFFKDTKQP
jgi:homoserine O-acetyltransferase